MKPFHRFMIAGLAGTVLTACTAVQTIPQGVILIGSERLSTLIEASAPQSAATETGTMRTVLSVRNHSKLHLMIEGRAVFAGERGEPVESPGAWQRLFIEGESSGTLQFLSMSSAARRATIELREGNR